MLKLHNLIREAKDKYGDKLKIMAGNIANPEGYRLLSEAGADYIRVGIGTGSVCITSSNTAIHYPMASLIKECYEVSLQLKSQAYIIADGGIKGYGDIEKALALGADYVMCGSIFNRMLESAGNTINSDGLMLNQYEESTLGRFKRGQTLYKSHYGMSTKRAQKEIGSKELKTSEGIEKTQKVEYTMNQWTKNCVHYLKSAMSYTGSRELYDFIGNVDTIIVSNNSYDSVNK
jgi:IMP dehydrogenase/GMP reductase